MIIAGASNPILSSIAVNAMGSAGNVFAESGPMHMMTKIGAASSPTTVEIDWDNEEHRRCITACLVKGTYLLESSRTSLEDDNSEQLVPAWWESFHFRRHRVLSCVCDCILCRVVHHTHGTRGTPFIYGAIFEYVPPAGAARRHPPPSAPSYVVAFRGTMLRDPTTLGDMRLNLRILLNEQHFCGRFSHARTKVEELLNCIPKNGGGGGVWLAGHSLGASIALDVGRHVMIMTEEELKLPTFLFNPPQVSLASLAPAINKLPIAEAARKGAHASSTVVKHVLGKTVLRPHRRNMEEKFERLSPWVPNLYVHPRDVICSGFIDYFEQRERHPRMAATATVMSYRDMCRSAIGKQNDRPHLLPSAVLWKNQSSHGNPHELRQWWQPQGPELELTRQLYKWS